MKSNCLDNYYHLRKAAKNITCTSHFILDEYIKIISNFIEEKLKQDLITSVNFTLLAGESTDKTDCLQLANFVRFVDVTGSLRKEKFLDISKIATSKTAEMVQLMI